MGEVVYTLAQECHVSLLSKLAYDRKNGTVICSSHPTCQYVVDCCFPNIFRTTLLCKLHTI